MKRVEMGAPIRVVFGDLLAGAPPIGLPPGRVADDEGGMWLVAEIAIGASLRVTDRGVGMRCGSASVET